MLVFSRYLFAKEVIALVAFSMATSCSSGDISVFAAAPNELCDRGLNPIFALGSVVKALVETRRSRQMKQRRDMGMIDIDLGI